MNATTRIVSLSLLVLCISASLYAQADYYTWASFPQIAFGGGYTTYLTISDPLANGPNEPRNVYVYLYDSNGNPLSATVDQGIGQISGEFHFMLSALQEKTFAFTGSSGTVAGRLEIAAEGIKRFNSSLRYAVTNSSGGVTDVVGVLPISPTYNWTITYDKRQASERLAVAIANWWADAGANIQFSLYQNGIQIGNTVTKDVPALGQRSFYVDDATLFPSFTGLGTLRISSPDVAVSVMAIRQDGFQFSSLPADTSAQLWRWTFNNGSATETGYWSFRFQEEGDFSGEEYNSWNSYFVRVRGIMDKEYKFFILEWWWYESATEMGTVLFQGNVSTQGSTQVITGKRVIMKSDGSIDTSRGPYSFTATRLY
jgi:hypothetical protein